MEEYDDGYDSAASFEAAGADRPEDMEPAEPTVDWLDVVRHFGLDESFQYTEAQVMNYTEDYKADMRGVARQPRRYTLDERLAIIDRIESYGGHFAKAIAKALLVADEGNLRRLEEAFPELLERYHKGL